MQISFSNLSSFSIFSLSHSYTYRFLLRFIFFICNCDNYNNPYLYCQLPYFDFYDIIKETFEMEKCSWPIRILKKQKSLMK